jgi:hypothetical protein
VDFGRAEPSRLPADHMLFVKLGQAVFTDSAADIPEYVAPLMVFGVF